MVQVRETNCSAAEYDSQLARQMALAEEVGRIRFLRNDLPGYQGKVARPPSDVFSKQNEALRYPFFFQKKSSMR